MVVAVFHITKMGMRIDSLDMIYRDDSIETLQERVTKGFRNRRYFPVATVPCEDLEQAWLRTNSIDDYWGADADLEIMEPENCPIYGQAKGHRSSMVGDIFINDEGVHVAAAFGFRKIFDLDDPHWQEIVDSFPEG